MNEVNEVLYTSDILWQQVGLGASFEYVQIQIQLQTPPRAVYATSFVEVTPSPPHPLTFFILQVMEEDSEVLDWGNEDDEQQYEQRLHNQQTGVIDGLEDAEEDAVSLGGDRRALYQLLRHRRCRSSSSRPRMVTVSCSAITLVVPTRHTHRLKAPRSNLRISVLNLNLSGK